MTTNLERLQQIVIRKQHGRLKFRGVKYPVKVDLFTASTMIAVYNKINDANKVKFARMLETLEGFDKLVDFSLKQVQEYGVVGRNPIRPRRTPYRGPRQPRRNPSKFRFLGWYYSKEYDAVDAVFADPDTNTGYTYYTHIGQHSEGLAPSRFKDLKRVSLEQARKLDWATVDEVMKMYGSVIKKSNPSYAYGPTGYRPPKKWFNKMLVQVKSQYKKLPSQTAKEYKQALSRIVGGIWSRFSSSTRKSIVRKYEPGAARAKGFNPFKSSGEVIVHLFGPEAEEFDPDGIGFLVNARTGKATNRWADGTAGIPKEAIPFIEEADEAIDPNTGKHLEWKKKNPIGTCPAHHNPIEVNPKAKRVYCRKGKHWLNVPK